jgi:hypothetical protein
MRLRVRAPLGTPLKPPECSGGFSLPSGIDLTACSPPNHRVERFAQTVAGCDANRKHQRGVVAIGLSSYEIQVSGLIGRVPSNPPSTAAAERRVLKNYSKFGLNSRSQVAVWAFEHGLLPVRIEP